MTAWEWISEPWGQAFMQHAFLEVALVGIVGGWLGCWVLLYGVSYSAESLSHGMFPGLVGASLLGFPLVAGGAVGAGAAAAGIAGLGDQRGIDRDTSVGVVITSLFGLGALLALMPDSPPGIQELLFGDVLAVSRRDLLVTALIALPVLALLWVLHERLLAVGFDRSTARAIGIAPRPVELVVMLLVAAAVVASVQTLGSLLVVAVLVAPAACARLLTHRLGTMLCVSIAVAIAAGAAGLYLSYYAGTAGGASIALCLVGAYLVALCADAAVRGASVANTCRVRRAPEPIREGWGMSDSVYRVTEIIGTSPIRGRQPRRTPCDRRAHDSRSARRGSHALRRHDQGREDRRLPRSPRHLVQVRRVGLTRRDPPYRRSPVRTRRSARSRHSQGTIHRQPHLGAPMLRARDEKPDARPRLAAVRAGAAQHHVVLVDRELEALRERGDGLLEAVVGELRDAAAAVADDVVVVLAAGVRGLVAGRAVADVEPVDEAEAIEHLERAVHARDAHARVVAAQLVGDLLRGGAAVLPREGVDDARARGAGAEALALERRVRVRAPGRVMGRAQRRW